MKSDLALRAFHRFFYYRMCILDETLFRNRDAGCKITTPVCFTLQK